VTKVLNDIHVGIQSYCLRKFTLDQIPGLLTECGIDTLEVSRAHIDLFDLNTDPDILLKPLHDKNIKISAYGSNRLTNDDKKVRQVFEFAKRNGINLLTADPDHDALDLLSHLCEEYDLRLAIHNHGKDDMRHGRASMLNDILESTSDNIGICLDTGWMIDAGDDPVAFVESNISRIFGIHLKDFSYSDEGKRKEELIGEGLLDLVLLFDVLKKKNYDGNITIEYEQSPYDPVPELRKCINNLIRAT
jgi:sugar phosphate isomerase/epimerase